LSGWLAIRERRNPVPDGDSTTDAIARTAPTTQWQKANYHAHLLDRAQVSALARQVITN
jgi:hypothetical protein